MDGSGIDLWYEQELKLERLELSLEYGDTLFHVFYKNSSIPETKGRPKKFSLISTENKFIEINETTGELYGTPTEKYDDFTVEVEACRVGSDSDDCTEANAVIHTACMMSKLI